jgi:hypothetical protein
MARPAKERQLHARIDGYLSYLKRNWNALTEVADEWPEMEEHERLDFVLEWPIREDRWLELQRWASQGQFTPAQRVRYDALSALITQHRPIIDRPLADEPSPTEPSEAS